MICDLHCIMGQGRHVCQFQAVVIYLALHLVQQCGVPIQYLGRAEEQDLHLITMATQVLPPRLAVTFCRLFVFLFMCHTQWCS